MKKLIAPILLLLSSCNFSKEETAQMQHELDSLNASVNESPATLRLQDSLLKVHNADAKKEAVLQQLQSTADIVKTDKELSIKFKVNWDNIRVRNSHYLDYLDSLEDQLKVMESITTQYNNQMPKLMALWDKLRKSKKHQDALYDYLKFGQLADNNDLFIPCKIYIENNAHDPSSIDIIDQQVQGRNKDGWIVLMRFRGKNAFGALVINTTQFTLEWVDTEKVYTVTNSTL